MRTTQQMSITLPTEMARLIKDRVASGAYATESEVIREGLRALQERETAVERWLREEVAPTYDAHRADPRSCQLAVECFYPADRFHGRHREGWLIVEYLVRLSPEAEADLQQIYALVGNAASPVTARSYINRILGFIAGFETFPERGTVRSDIRPGLRMIGFERRITVAFVVEGDEVIILRLLYAGRAGEFD